MISFPGLTSEQDDGTMQHFDDPMKLGSENLHLLYSIERFGAPSLHLSCGNVHQFAASLKQNTARPNIFRGSFQQKDSTLNQKDAPLNQNQAALNLRGTRLNVFHAPLHLHSASEHVRSGYPHFRSTLMHLRGTPLHVK